jgi:hypothetical protein
VRDVIRARMMRRMPLVVDPEVRIRLALLDRAQHVFYPGKEQTGQDGRDNGADRNARSALVHFLRDDLDHHLTDLVHGGHVGGDAHAHHDRFAKEAGLVDACAEFVHDRKEG